MQLDLVQAAQILPVSHDKSTDETSNGTALYANHHAAFSAGLVYIDEDYTIQVNPEVADELDGGFQNFVSDLQDKITVTMLLTNRQHVEFIRLRNEYRGIFS